MDQMDIERIEAIFWDFDGVILDSTRVKDEAFAAMFAEFGEPVVEKVLAHHRAHGGISRVEKIAHYHREFLNDPLSEAALAEKCRQFSERVVDQVVRSPWIAGTKAFLEAFSSRIDMFVISGTPEAELALIIDRREMAGYFKGIFGSPVKKPDHIRALLTAYDFNPDRCFFIGDALTDYRAARETGVHFIGVQGPAPFPADALVLQDCTNLEAAIAGR